VCCVRVPLCLAVGVSRCFSYRCSMPRLGCFSRVQQCAKACCYQRMIGCIFCRGSHETHGSLPSTQWTCARSKGEVRQWLGPRMTCPSMPSIPRHNLCVPSIRHSIKSTFLHPRRKAPSSQKPLVSPTLGSEFLPSMFCGNP
jgi:hypothetical protein